MQLTQTSHMSFNIFIGGKLAFKNENIFFTVLFAKCWNDPEFYKVLENIDVCTTIEISEKQISIFKN
jgi:hypothetical protein